MPFFSLSSLIQYSPLLLCFSLTHCGGGMPGQTPQGAPSSAKTSLPTKGTAWTEDQTGGEDQPSFEIFQIPPSLKNKLSQTTWEVSEAYCNQEPLRYPQIPPYWLFSRNASNDRIFGELATYAIPGVREIIQKTGTTASTLSQEAIQQKMDSSVNQQILQLALTNTRKAVSQTLTDTGAWEQMYDDIAKTHRYRAPYLGGSLPLRISLNTPSAIQWKFQDTQGGRQYVDQVFSLSGSWASIKEASPVSFVQNPYVDRPILPPKKFKLGLCEKPSQNTLMEEASLCISQEKSLDPLCPQGTLFFRFEEYPN